MHIALVYPACHRRGGVERVVWEAARYLASRHQVTLVCRRGGASDLPAEVAVLAVGAPAAGALAPVVFRVAARRALRALEPDVTVAFGYDCPSPDVLVVGSVHAAWLRHGGAVSYGPLTVPAGFRRMLPRHQVRLVLERLTMGTGRGRRGGPRRRPRTFIAVSDTVADDLVRLYGCPPDAIEVVPNGFDPAQCSPARRAGLRAGARRAAGLTGPGPVLLMVANEWHRKGLGVLITALGLLPQPPPALVLVGRMAPTRYADQIAAAGLGDLVRYLGPMDDIAAAYAAADLFVLPTQYEPFGMVIVEALACGLPVVTTALAGASSTVHPGVNGLLQADPHDPVELAGLLGQALSDDTLSTWSRAAAGAVAGYEWPSLMARMEAVVVGAHSVAKPPAGPPP